MSEATPSYTSSPEAAVRALNAEIRSLRARLSAATYQIEDLTAQLAAIPGDMRACAAMLAEARLQVEGLLDANRLLSATVSQHRDSLDALRTRLADLEAPETAEVGLLSVLDAVLMLEEVSNG